MASSRPVWRGHLRFALVSCPIALYSVIRGSSGLHLHFINPKTGHRVRMISQDAETEEEVSRRDLVKGFEFEKDHYVLLDEQDFEQARIESSTTLTIGKFVEAASVPAIFFDTSYYVAHDGESGQDVFVVLRDAIRQSGVAALSRIVIAKRERAVAILPAGPGLVCHTLHEPSDLWDYGPLLQDITDVKAEGDMVELATQLIKRQTGKFHPDDTTDRYEAKLRDVIEAKLKGEGITPEQLSEPDRGNVVDLMAALKQSLGQQQNLGQQQEGSGRQTTPARKSAPASAVRDDRMGGL